MWVIPHNLATKITLWMMVRNIAPSLHYLTNKIVIDVTYICLWTVALKIILFQTALNANQKIFPNALRITSVTLCPRTFQAIYKRGNMRYLQTTIVGCINHDRTPHFIRITWPNKIKNNILQFLQKAFRWVWQNQKEEDKLREGTSFNDSVPTNRGQISGRPKSKCILKSRKFWLIIKSE